MCLLLEGPSRYSIETLFLEFMYPASCWNRERIQMIFLKYPNICELDLSISMREDLISDLFKMISTSNKLKFVNLQLKIKVSFTTHDQMQIRRNVKNSLLTGISFNLFNLNF
jgi:hypothetical protein